MKAMTAPQTSHTPRINTQRANIYNYLQKKSITPLEALTKFGCFRLSAVIFDLRDAGHTIITEMIYDGGKKYARYSLVKPR